MADLIRSMKSRHGFVRLISFTLCLCLLFSLAACDSAEEEPGTSDTLDVSNPPTEDVSDEAEDDPDEIAQPDETPDETGEESGEEDGASSAWEDVQAQVEALGLPEGPKFSGFENFSFAGPYLESLGEFRQDLVEPLSLTDDVWEYLEVDGLPGPRPSMREPVEIGGEDYTLYLRFTQGPERDTPGYLSYYYFERTVEGDAAAKDAAIQALYEQLVMELGEPEEPGTNVAFMVENDGLSPEDYIADTETEQPPLYDTVRGGIEAGAHGAQEYEKWVLADGILYPGMVVDALKLGVEPETVTDENVALLVTLGVNNNSSSVVLTVTMQLISVADTEVARYQDERTAKFIEERIAERQARKS